MNFKTIIWTIFFLSSNLLAAPTAKYPDIISLLNNELKPLKKDAVLFTVVPLPIPIFNNYISGKKSWKKYKLAKKMLHLYTSANAVISEQENPLVEGNYEKLNNHIKRVKNFLTKIQKDARRSIREDNLNPRLAEQIALDKKIETMDFLKLSLLLNRANKLIPPSLGNSQTGEVNFSEYNLIYRIRTIDLEDRHKSMLEKELDAEEILAQNRLHQSSLANKLQNQNAEQISIRSNQTLEFSGSTTLEGVDIEITDEHKNEEISVQKDNPRSLHENPRTERPSPNDTSSFIDDETHSESSQISEVSEKWKEKLARLKIELRNPRQT